MVDRRYRKKMLRYWAREEAKADVAGALLRLLQRAASTGRKDVQCWVSLAADTGNSALSLHSCNPQGTPWPHPFEGTRWDADMPDWLAPLLPVGMQAGCWGEGEHQVWMVRAGAPGNASGAPEAKA